MKAVTFLFISLMLLPIMSHAKKCADFKTQQEAQKWYEERKRSGQTGWKSLDRDKDGKACDCLPGGNGQNCPRK